MEVLIVGVGRVGLSLARRFVSQGIVVTAWNEGPLGGPARVLPGARHLTSAPASPMTTDLALLCVPENELPLAYEATRTVLSDPETPVLHTSGSMPARARPDDPRPQGRMHPAYGFPDEFVDPEALDSLCFLVEGDPSALTAATRLLQRANIQAVTGRQDVDPLLYHTACVLASNIVAAAVTVSQRLLGQSGLSQDGQHRIAMSLLRSVLANSTRTGSFQNALSGPAVRGDSKTVLAELARLEQVCPEWSDLYLSGSIAVALLAGQEALASLLRKERKRREDHS